MKDTKFRPLHWALAGCFATAAGSSQAVYLSPDGMGQALVYPYYTVQSAGGNSFNTYLSVVNTTTRAKAVKVRFREGKAGRAVLDFNLYLSPNDVWTAAMGPQDAAASSPAVLVTGDRSCTSPPIPQGGVAFRNSSYVGAGNDGLGTTLDRTREGYFEIIEMATLKDAAAVAVTHNFAGTPANCAFVQSGTGVFTSAYGDFLQPPAGGLMGTYTLINVANGLNFAGNATALNELFATPKFTEAPDPLPDLASADPIAATAVQNDAGAMVGYRSSYANGRDAVSATLMKTSVINEFALDAETRSATDFVLTFPTKSFYVAGGGAPSATPFFQGLGPNGACEPISVEYFNRERAGAVVSDGQLITPLPPGFIAPAPCWSVSIFSVVAGSAGTTRQRSSIFGSSNAMVFGVDAPNGWMQFTFAGSNVGSGISSLGGSASAVDMAARRSLAGTTTTHFGLPVIGFAARTLNNGLLSCTIFGGSTGTCVGSYGMLTDHRYRTRVSPTP